MSFPKTLTEMEEQGYRRAEYSRCKGCYAAMEWWTTPMGGRIPMDPMGHPDSAAISHFATCSHHHMFRKPPQPVRRVPKPDAQPQPMLFEDNRTQAEDYDGAAHRRKR
jgi:hypothetical protein